MRATEGVSEEGGAAEVQLPHVTDQISKDSFLGSTLTQMGREEDFGKCSPS